MRNPAPRYTKRKHSQPKTRSSIWIVINLLLVGAALFILYRRQHPLPEPPPPAPVAVSTPEPAALPTVAPAATPAPSAPPIVAVSPTPQPVPSPPPPIVLSTVDPKILPRQVVLLKPEDFVMVSPQGQPVGSVHAAAGVQVDLVDVASDGEIEVQMGELRKTIPAADTDIESRVRTLLKYH